MQTKQETFKDSDQFVSKKKKKTTSRVNPPSKSYTPKGAPSKSIVKALGKKKSTGKVMLEKAMKRMS